MKTPAGVDVHDISSREQWLLLRQPNIGASEVGALFRAHPYRSYARLAAEKKGLVFPEKETGAMRRGRWYEDGVRNAVAEQRPDWTIIKASKYYCDPKLKLGATPDFYIFDRGTEPHRKGVLQTKTVERSAFAKYWTETTPPFWITLQVVTEMMLTGAEFGAIGAGVFDPHNPEVCIYLVPRQPEIEQRIRAAVKQFWFNLENGVEAELDYEQDAALLAVLYPAPVPGKQIDMRGDNRIGELLETRETLRDLIKATEQKLKPVETEIKAKLQDAESALVRGWNVTLRLQHRAAYSVAETNFRLLKASRLMTAPPGAQPGSINNIQSKEHEHDE